MSENDFFKIAYTIETTEEARQMYDRWAQVYDEDLTLGNYQQPARCASALKHQLSNKNALILDVGCGTGLSGIALNSAGYSNLHGCDLSEGMLKKARALGIYEHLFSCDLNVPPISDLDEQYDALTAVGVFSFGHIMADAVDELLRVVKPQAPLIIGLNDHFYEEGSLTNKLNELESEGKIEIISQEHGEHIPENDLKGWVISFRKK